MSETADDIQLMIIRAHNAYSLGCCVDGIADVLAAGTAVGGQTRGREGVSVNGVCVCVHVCVGMWVCVCMCMCLCLCVWVCVRKLMSVKF